MNFEVFDEMSENQKLEALLINGRVISENRNKRNRCFLYHMGSFYASVEYQTATDEMIAIMAFEKIGREERIKWKVLQVLPSLHKSRNFDELHRK